MVLYPIDHENYGLIVQSIKCKLQCLETEVENLKKRDKINEFVKRSIERRYQQIYKLQTLLIDMKSRHDAF